MGIAKFCGLFYDIASSGSKMISDLYRENIVPVWY
jgi:hypothetical protein